MNLRIDRLSSPDEARSTVLQLLAMARSGGSGLRFPQPDDGATLAELARDLASTPAGAEAVRNLAMVLAEDGRGRELASLVELTPALGAALIRALRPLANILWEVGASQDLTLDLTRGAGRELAQTCTEGPLGFELGQLAATRPLARGFSLALAGKGRGREFITGLDYDRTVVELAEKLHPAALVELLNDLAFEDDVLRVSARLRSTGPYAELLHTLNERHGDRSQELASAMFVVAAAGGIVGAAANVILLVAMNLNMPGEPAGSNVQAQNIGSSPVLPETVRDLVPELAFQDAIGPGEAVHLRQQLESLVGWASQSVDDGRFANEPQLEDQVVADRNFVHGELLRSPAVDAAVMVPIVQRLLRALIQSLPPETDGWRLASEIAGASDVDPKSVYSAIERADALAQHLEEAGELPPDGVRSWRLWISGRLGWTHALDRTDVGIGGGALVTGSEIASMLGVANPVGIVVGVVTAVLAVAFRPRR